MTAPATVTQAAIRRAIKAAQECGLPIVAIDMAHGRLITSEQQEQTGTPTTAGPKKWGANEGGLSGAD